MMTVDQLVQRAVARRATLPTPETNAFRVFHGAGDGLPGLTVDRFDTVLVANHYPVLQGMPLGADWRPVARALAEAWGAQAIYVKERPTEASKLSAAEKQALAPAAPWWGAALPEVTIRENGLAFLIRPGEGLSVGLFLDMREARARVRAIARGKTVLNCFAYTCGFGVAAQAGGAARALNLDISKPYLAWGKRNAAANALPVDDHDYVFGDVFDWLQRLARAKKQFEMVILDPPSYATTKTSRFAVEKDYAALVALAAPLVAPSGTLLACANTHTQAPHAFRAQVREGLREFPHHSLKLTHEPEADFPHAPGETDYLKACEIVIK